MPERLQHLRRLSIAALAMALDAGDHERSRAALADAIRSGALAGQPGGVMTPTVRVAAADLPGKFAAWLARGFVPFRAKPLTCPDDRRAGVARLMIAATGVAELACVPHWVVGGNVLTLQLDRAADLRHAIWTGAAAGRDWVHDTCIRSLRAFAGHDAALRAALAAGGQAAEPFPVAERYLAARAFLVQLLGPLDLPAKLPRLRHPGPGTLFCDPKPANFIMPREMVAGGPAAGWPQRIDLDLLYYECMVSLQLVIALFAYPIALPADGPGAVGFAGLVQDACRAGRLFGIEPEEIEVMLLYHLVRNFASAARNAAAEARKAAALAPVLCTATTSLASFPPAQTTAAALAAWSKAQDSHG